MFQNSLSTTECDVFEYGRLCTFENIDIVGLETGLDDEVTCQQECSRTANCLYFRFEAFSEHASQCFLLQSCNTTIPCDEDQGCIMAVSGPVKPDIVDVCCDGFSGSACSLEFVIAGISNVGGAEQCQNLCRGEKQCRLVQLCLCSFFLHKHVYILWIYGRFLMLNCFTGSGHT